MNNRNMLKDAEEFVKVLSKQEHLGQALAELKRRLKLYSKNDLIRLTSAHMFKANVLEARVKELEGPDDAQVSNVPSTNAGPIVPSEAGGTLEAIQPGPAAANNAD